MSNLKHIAIIMDGNGRWAQNRSHRRIWGHIRGSAIVSDIILRSSKLGVESLTLYTFSTENWSRPATEIKVLFHLLKKWMLRERPRIIANKIKFSIMGDISRLPVETQKIVHSIQEETKDFTGLKLSFAFSYSGQLEIVNAANEFFKDSPGETLTPEKLSKYLYNSDVKEIDLLIRTGGDFRISNFLLWQAAYAELYFTPIMWPDFTADEYERILREVSCRERRFGGVGKDLDLSKTSTLAKINQSMLHFH